MKLIVGLGNPGDSYAHSRHNIGFSVVKELAKNQRVAFKRDFSSHALVAKARIRQQGALFALPATFMNLSGSAVARLIRKHKCALSDLLVISDDMDLEFGRMKLRPGGSSGGHRGIESIIEQMHTRDFCRLRVGVGRPAEGLDAAEYVLKGFSRQEKEELRGIIDKASACCESWAAVGAAKTMNIFNKRSQEDE